MSYISPIKIEKISQMEEGWADKIGKYIAGEVDNLVLQSCVKVGCHVDKDELEKALRYDRGQYEKGYEDGKRDAASPWHRVEKGQPDEKKDAIFYYEWTGLNGIRGKEISTTSLDELMALGCRPIAWMEKPEPPKEDA